MPVRPIIIGPKTRLARQLILQLSQDGARWSRPVLIARSEREQARLALSFKEADTVSFANEQDPLHCPSQPVVVFCCAIGPVHARQRQDPQEDLASVERELATMIKLRDVLRAVPVHFVYVSSVLSVSSSPQRNYYAGWKRAIEAAIDAAFRQHPDCRFSVLYPGRLVETKSCRRPKGLLSTTYAGLASVTLSIALGPAVRRIIGVDARLYLLLRWLRSAWAIVAGRPY